MNTDILIADAATPPLMNAFESGGKLDGSQRVRTTLCRGKR
jgi:hypothetical protein